MAHAQKPKLLKPAEPHSDERGASSATQVDTASVQVSELAPAGPGAAELSLPVDVQALMGSVYVDPLKILAEGAFPIFGWRDNETPGFRILNELGRGLTGVTGGAL